MAIGRTDIGTQTSRTFDPSKSPSVSIQEFSVTRTHETPILAKIVAPPEVVVVVVGAVL